MLEKLYMLRNDYLYTKGKRNGDIVPFEDSFCDKMKTTYLNGIPIYFRIKYFVPDQPPMECLERSLLMFHCFSDATLVRADSVWFGLMYGPTGAFHGWIEIGDYVYDPTLLLRFKKDVYYKMLKPYNVVKYDKDEYCKDESTMKEYNYITSTTLDDLKPGGDKRTSLAIDTPILKKTVDESNNEDLKREFYEYLDSIEFDYDEVMDEVSAKYDALIKEKIKKTK